MLNTTEVHAIGKEYDLKKPNYPNHELLGQLYKPDYWLKDKLPQEERVICSLSTEMDTWVWHNCPIKFVLAQILEQYNGPPHKHTLGQ